MEMGCQDCGYNSHPAALDFDHPPGVEKLGTVSGFILKFKLKEAIQELHKCEVVCANCHRIRTWKRRRENPGL